MHNVYGDNDNSDDDDDDGGGGAAHFSHDSFCACTFRFVHF